MRDRLLGLLGVGTALAAAAWGLAGGPAGPVATLVVIGLVIAGADALVWRFADPDLALPHGRSLPAAPWGRLVGPAALLGLVAALAVGAVALAVVAGLLVLLTLAGLVRPLAPGSVAHRVARPARRIRTFARAHGIVAGESVSGYATGLGEPGVRLLVVAPDGSWADLLTPAEDAALVAELARVELREPTDPWAGRAIRIGEPFWARMTGST